MSSRTSHIAPPPSSYSPISPTDPSNVLGKDKASSTRSNRSSAFSFKNAKGFKRVFGLLGKDASSNEGVNTGLNASRFRNGRRDSESAMGSRNAVVASTSSSLNTSVQSRLGNEGGPLYRSRNARSMDALKLFTKNTKPPMTATSKPYPSGNHRPAPSTGSMGVGANVVTIHPNGRDEKDMPVLQLEDVDVDDAGNGSTSTESDRSIRAEGNSSVIADYEITPPPISISGGIGGPPPPGAMGAVHLPPSRPPPPPPLSTIPNEYGRVSTKAASEYTAAATSAELPQPRSRPSKPSLSIPISPRTSHEKAVSASAILPTQSPVSVSSAGPPSHSAITPSRTKSPPSPGFGLSLRLTPSITMSRPVWPLPPLPPMPTDTPPIPVSLSGVSGAGNGMSWSTSNGKSLPMFRLTPPTRSMTGPSPSTSAADSVGGGGASVRRSVSVKLNAMPSLSVMGETEHGDPEADDMMDEDEDEDDEMEEEEQMPIGRPSIDSVISIDSMVSVETVRAQPPPALSVSSSSRPNARQIPVGGPIAPAEKGKGKAKKQRGPVDEDGEGESASDSDDSVYFDARDSVFLSPRDVAKALERRASQISQRNSSIRDSRILSLGAGVHSESSPGTGRREGPRDPSRDRRDSSWSFSTAGRESVYLTPSEGSAWSTAATPHGSTIAVSTASDLTNSGFAREVSSKRSSVPVGFGAMVNSSVAGSLGTRRGAGSRLSMGSAAELPNIESSSLNFDVSNFGIRTPTSGRLNKPDAGPAASVPDGLPTIRGEGLPNFDTAVAATGQGVGGSDPTTPKERESQTPKAEDYFNAKMNYPPSTSASQQRRRGSLSASVSVPTSIAEGVVAVEREGQAMSLSPVSSIPSSTPSAISQNQKSIVTQPRRPSVYRQASRSMVDLSTSPGMGMDDVEEREADHKADASVISGPPELTASPLQRSPPRTPATNVDTMAWLAPPPSPSITRPSAHRKNTLRRVSSVPLLQSGDMPLTAVEKPPPAYHAIPRREEEGKEVLPRYYNDIILAGLLHRKMEFERPGLQARDRSWRKLWCVLQGTSFRVYKVGTLEVKFGALAAVPTAGSLPLTSATSVLAGGRVRGSSFGISNVAGRRGSGATPPVSGIDQSGSSGKAPLTSTSGAEVVLTKNQQNSTSPSLLAPPSVGSPGSPASASTSTNSRCSGSSQAPSRASFSSSRPTTPARPGTSNSFSSPSQGRSRAQEAPTGHGLGGRSVIDNGGLDIYTPMQSALLRQYSLQSAESGLATDYMKRRNVIRVRLEGEQFLLQVPGVEEVVEWIEGFQASANVALDLDVRPMPKGALYPRRRRRRRPRQAGEPATQSPLSPPPNPPTGTSTATSSTSRTSTNATAAS